ncbi:MAG: sigma 54-interacting transcriptional regulator [Proteobacteria bacterium]|nr:sigma 54-interacting transcriptional regulator [Pseudomonadota bacterium]MBU1710156.1 sigma 54-interacting transcriptional regulator [Pseudomonadota bacterium]
MKKQNPPLDEHISLLEVINSLPHGVAVLGQDGTIAKMNHYLEACTGYATEKVCGTSVDQVIRTNLAIHSKFFLQTASREEQIIMEGDTINANRKRVPVRLTLSPLFGETHEVKCFLLLLEDLSSQRAIQQNIHDDGKKMGIIGHSPKMQEIFELLPILTHTDTTLLITGETGTGKDFLAETIHQLSSRSKAPFIKVNCGALPEALLESELFGYVRGAFTGAHADKPGMFRLSQGGTIFLTEIGDLPVALQTKLLTVLDDKEFYPLGSSKKVKVDVRLITATHHDLRRLVQQGKFREDLYYRLNVLRTHLPPLRERGDDIKLLLEHFLHKFSQTLEKNIRGFNQDAETCLLDYHFPGNVRELSNIAEYAANICQGELIKFSHLPAYLHTAIADIPEPADSTKTTGQGNERAATISNWSHFEKKKIFDSLVNTDGNRTQTAKQLGWGRSKLWRKMKLYGLE